MVWRCGIGLILVLNWFRFESNLVMIMVQFEEIWKCKDCEHCHELDDSTLWPCDVWGATVWYLSCACRYFEERIEVW